MPPLQQAWMSPVTSRHRGTEPWVYPWAKPEPFLWGAPQFQIWSWIFWLKPIPTTSFLSCLLYGHIPNLPTPAQKATSTEMAKGLVRMSQGPLSMHAQAGREGVGCREGVPSLLQMAGSSGGLGMTK